MTWALSVERACTLDELAAAASRILERPVRVEARAHPGDFALRVTLDGDGDAIAFYRAFAAALACKLLVDDGEVDPYTAMLVMPDGTMLRVHLDPEALDRDDQTIRIAGLHEHVDNDDLPDPTATAPEPPAHRRRYLRTRGDQLSLVVNAFEGRVTAPPDPDAFAAAYTPDVQDAEHALTECLRELVHRKSTPEDERAIRRQLGILQRAFPDPRAAGTFLPEVMRCAAEVLAHWPWDPEAAS